MIRKSILHYLIMAFSLVSFTYGMKEDLNKQLLGAAQNGNLAQVKELLKNEFVDVNCIDISNIYDHTSLSYACAAGHFEIVKLLVEHKANINYIAPKGYYPLYWACIRGHLRIVKLLLSKGAQIYQDSGKDPLLFLSLNEYPDIVKTFLDYGANPNIINAERGTTPLIAAAMTGNIKIVQLLLDNNADTNIKTRYDKKTARDYAFEGGYGPIVVAIDRAENKRAIQLLVSQRLLAPRMEHTIQYLLAINRI